MARAGKWKLLLLLASGGAALLLHLGELAARRETAHRKAGGKSLLPFSPSLSFLGRRLFHFWLFLQYKVSTADSASLLYKWGAWKEEGREAAWKATASSHGQAGRGKGRARKAPSSVRRVVRPVLVAIGGVRVGIR